MCQCALNDDGLEAISFIANVFQTCLYTPLEIVSFVTGWLCIVGYMCGHYPQLRMFFMLRSANGLSPWSTLLWFVGDTLNFVSCLVTKQLFTLKMQAIYYMVVDGTFFLLYFIFGKSCRERKQQRAQRREEKEHEDAELPARKQTIRQSLRKASIVIMDKASLRGSLSLNPQASEILRKRASIINSINRTAIEEAHAELNGLPVRRSLGPSGIRVAAPQPADASAEAEIVDPETRPAQRFTYTRGELIRTFAFLILIIACLTLLMLYADAKQQLDPVDCPIAETSDSVYVIGVVMGYLSALIYCSSSPILLRSSLLQKNGWNKSPILFLGAGTGNMFNLISIFTSPLSWQIMVARGSYTFTAFFTGTAHFINAALTFYYRKYPGGKRLARFEQYENAQLYNANPDEFFEKTSSKSETLPSLGEGGSFGDE